MTDLASLPRHHFAAILADPPWSFQTWSDKGKDRAADNHYRVMPPSAIAAMPVADLAAKDCVLFLWACWPMLTTALDVIEWWGFRYKTVAFSWMKTNSKGKPFVGLGYWTRANTEVCLLATRGKPKRLHADVSQVIVAQRREHSRKPDCVHERIERLVAGPYLELFARAERPGWTTWGNETRKFG